MAATPERGQKGEIILKYSDELVDQMHNKIVQLLSLGSHMTPP